MGFFFRKSFRFGPARVNLSKAGLGVSGGTKGARLGIGTRGAYIAGGLKGIYYRKRLGGAGGHSSGESELSVAAVIAIWLVILAGGAIVGVVLWFMVWAMLR